ncbi:MAG: transcriptional regulator NrdR [Elusimicrobia bacterium RIFOXYB2_FULL_62_6]|nr:MAG: transcriptional regulator NrdR [Elusimicrobia bacterium RIFOXYB2_FULL_62_6]
MKCPFCGALDTKVTDSRDSDVFETRRRRECEKCGKRFTTYERIEQNPRSKSLIIVKKDGRREEFSRDKLKSGLIKACQKRDIRVGKIDEAVGEIESALRDANKGEVPSALVGELVIKKLKKIDKIAYIRFASVYKDFSDVKDFETEIKSIKEREEK